MYYCYAYLKSKSISNVILQFCLCFHFIFICPFFLFFFFLFLNFIQALEDDITSHSKHLHQAVSIGQSLKVLSSREDKDLVQNKLDFCQVWYIEIQEKSHRRSELLQQALCNAKIFGEDEVELMNWLNEVHDKLSKLSVQDYSTEGLWKQQSELRVFGFLLFYFFHFSSSLLCHSSLFMYCFTSIMFQVSWYTQKRP